MTRVQPGSCSWTLEINRGAWIPEPNLKRPIVFGESSCDPTPSSAILVLGVPGRQKTLNLNKGVRNSQYPIAACQAATAFVPEQF